jgi:hypothetical protein
MSAIGGFPSDRLGRRLWRSGLPFFGELSEIPSLDQSFDDS